MNAGVTLHLLQAFAWSVYKSVCGGDVDHDKFLSILAEVERELPASADYCTKIKHIYSGSITGKDVWNVLPFNYQ